MAKRQTCKWKKAGKGYVARVNHTVCMITTTSKSLWNMVCLGPWLKQPIEVGASKEFLSTLKDMGCDIMRKNRTH